MSQGASRPVPHEAEETLTQLALLLGKAGLRTAGDDSALLKTLEELSLRVQKLERKEPLTVRLLRESRSPLRLDSVHRAFPLFLQVLSLKTPVLLVGPAGGGKSWAAAQAAKSLCARFFAQSVCAQTSKSELLGYMDAQGRYVRSLFREAYECGGLFVLDEIDAGNPNVLAVLNSSLTSAECAFPDGMISKHKEFLFCATANTYGRGADRQYVGRSPLDAATLNRFAVLTWDYDEALELNLCTHQEDWVRFVQACRRIAFELKIKHVISPRASIEGAKLLEAGIDKDAVAEMLLWQGLDMDSRSRIESRL